MKKNALLIILFFVLFLCIFVLNKIFNVNTINYTLNSKYKIKEIHYRDNYYFEVKIKKNIYPFRIYYDLNNQKKVISDILYYKDKNYECILPVFNKVSYTDFMCMKDNIIYDYNAIKTTDIKLDEFVKSAKYYNKSILNNIENFKGNNIIKYNNYNINNIVAITTYNGLQIDKYDLTLFENDVYKNELSIFTGNYYLSANYNSKYEFNEFYLVDLYDKKVEIIKSKYDISFDSYIQGVVDNKIYLYDIDNESQYEIDVNLKLINLISNNKYIKYYSNNKWGKLNKNKANKKVLFNYDSLDNNFTKYDLSIESDNYYYLFENQGIYYKLYRADKNNINIVKSLIDVPTTNISFKDNYLYYVYKDTLYYYSDSALKLEILKNSELEYNNSIKYYIY
ncbi:MAG: hypothetical protein Q4E75_03915 [bacterium]|nr:hypothetical protein [bacterium]